MRDNSYRAESIKLDIDNKVIPVEQLELVKDVIDFLESHSKSITTSPADNSSSNTPYEEITKNERKKIFLEELEDSGLFPHLIMKLSDTLPMRFMCADTVARDYAESIMAEAQRKIREYIERKNA